MLKLFHFGRFDIAAMKQALASRRQPVWCTKIASKLVRTFTDRHGLKYLLADLVGVDVSKQQQTSDWGAEMLTDAQKEYAASDVLYLHTLKARAGGAADPRRPAGPGAALFRFPADAGRAGSAGLG